MTGPSSAVTVARSVADAVVELAWATRPGQPLSDVDRYVVVTALGAAAAVLPQVLTQACQGVPDSRDAAREALHAATVAAHDLAHLLDAAAQYLA
jgi:HD superfamily phosphodiesterase